MKFIFKSIGVAIIFVSLSLYSDGVKAEGGPETPCSDPDVFDPCCLGGSPSPENPACPIDGGVVALLAAGVGYGLKRVRDSRKKEKEALDV